MSLMNGYDALASFLAASPIGSANAGAAPMVAAVAAPSAAAAPAVGRAGGTNVEVKMLQPSKAPMTTRQADATLLFTIAVLCRVGVIFLSECDEKAQKA